MSTVNKIPKSEDGFGVRYTSESGNIYIVSHNTKKEKFTLWEQEKNGYEKISSADNPIVLYKKCI